MPTCVRSFWRSSTATRMRFLLYILTALTAHGAVSLNGSSQYGIVEQVPPTNYPFTIACWVYPTATNALAMAYGACTNANNNAGYQLIIAGSGIPGFRAGDTSGASTGSGTTQLPINAWTHLCGVGIDATTRVLYVNGIAAATNTSSRVPAAANRTAVGGRITGTPAQFWPGYVSDAATWSVALSADEVAVISGLGDPTKAFAPIRVRPEAIAVAPELAHDGNGAHSRNRVGAVLGFTNAPTTVAGPPIQK